jgi:U4/U6.U5 tri-snRNP-associated protein 2
MTAHDDVPKMTVAKLRDALKKKGLDTAGLKAALVERLQEALRSDGGDAKQTPSPKPSPAKKSPKPSPSRATKRKRDSMSEPAPAPAPEPAPAPTPTPAPEPASEPAVAADARPSPPPARDCRAPVSGLDARAAAIAALQVDLAAEEPEDDAVAAAAAASARRARAAAASRACPYLDTVHRAVLDFDFEKCCSVSLSPHNAYACLVCGKYFQGRGPSTHAYTHALEASHHVFLRLDDGRAYCLPDGYEIEDASLDDVRAALAPRFTPEEARRTSVAKQWRRGLDGSEYLAGAVGLNNLKHTTYVNATLQAFARVEPLRLFFLNRREASAAHAKRAGALAARFGELTRKMWNPRAFKGQVSPHEFMRAVVASSGGAFKVDHPADPVDFMRWLMHALHRETRRGDGRGSVVDDCFAGEMETFTTGEPLPDGETNADVLTAASVKRAVIPFRMLALDLPPPPLFQDAMEKNIIPQVPIADLLRKYDGATPTPTPRGGTRTFKITRLPKYLVVHYKRFTKNAFFREKNPTIVTFPIGGRPLRLADHVPTPIDPASNEPAPSSYDLVANVCHDGAADAGAFRAQVFHRADGNWYDARDLAVDEVLPQQVALAETYVQIWERREADVAPRRAAEEDAFGLGDLGGEDAMET